MSAPLALFARPRRLAGLSLTELLIAVLLLALVMGALSRVLTSAWASEADVNDQNLAQKYAQRAADDICDSLRGATQVSAATESTLQVVLLNGDVLAYYLDADTHTLHRVRTHGATSTDQTVSDHISALHFSYWHYLSPFSIDDCVEVPPALFAQAESIRVSVTVTTDQGEATEASSVRPRNLPLNRSLP